MPLVPGTRPGPYEIVALLGAGGMGEVYRALDTRLDRTVAIKVIRQEAPAQAVRVGRPRCVQPDPTLSARCPDGQRFLMIRSEQDAIINQINVVLNWAEELKRLMREKEKKES